MAGQDGAGPHLWDEGIDYRGPATDPLGRVVKHELCLGAAASLADLEGEYAFFTPAILYLLGVVTDRPLADMMWELRRDMPIYFKKFRRPLFRRLVTADGDPDWNYVLWAVPREHWDYFLDFYCSIAVRNLTTKQLHRVAAQQLRVLDPVQAERHVLLTGLPLTAEVTALGVNSTEFVAAFECNDPLLAPPSLRFYPPDEKTRVFAAALARGDNPHVAEELYLARQARKGAGGGGAEG